MSTSSDSARTVIGKIIGAHGIKGAIRVHPLTDFPERFMDMESLYIEKQGKSHSLHKELEVVLVTSHDGKGQFLFTVEGVNDRDAAEALSGWFVTVSPEERVELSEDEYWIDSLIGLEVIDSESGEHLGTIEDVMQTGSNDVYQVRTPEGAVKVIPAIADVVLEIDVEGGTMKISMMEGLWD